MRIIIPPKFHDVLSNEGQWFSFVNDLMMNVEPYFLSSPYFFPEYTFHGIDHINRVLDIAERLIPNETIGKLSSLSIAVLVSSIIVHDIGMFIEKDGLNKILNVYKERKVPHLDDYSWETLWTKYLKRAYHYSEKELLSIFGSPEPVVSPHDLTTEQVNDRDRKVYGEFIRQNHHRLSYEIILFGFLGTNDRSIFNRKMNEDIIKIVGIIARSHGMNIRDTESYLKNIFGEDDNFKFPLDIPIYFLMIILRLADYLDAGIERAPIEKSDAQASKSKISQGEWRWNQTLSYTTGFRWDYNKKKLNIHVNPQNSVDFLGVENWLKNIQKEIDQSWAYLSEYYMFDYSISLHRVTSNIFDSNVRNEYSKKFATKAFRLNANPEILKLLIRPLYHGDQSYGVRELLHNAVDACNERESYENREYQGDIRISINTKTKTFTIVDNGTGMNEEILLDYFLSAGASYRFNDNWIKNNTDENGYSTITRSGRFGIGVLSSFLIGDRITVTTQYFKEHTGYKFTFGIGTDVIEVGRKKRKEGSGTTIEILMNHSSIAFFLHTNKKLISSGDNVAWYDWFHFKEPKVRYFIDDLEVYEVNEFVPNDGESNWNNLTGTDYHSYKYKFKKGYEPKFFCNGIRIQNIDMINYEYFGMKIAQTPSLSIVDRNNKLNVNLLRSVFEFPNPEQFVVDVYKRIISDLLNADVFSSNVINCVDGQDRYLIFSKHGYTLFNPVFMANLNIDKICVFVQQASENADYSNYIDFIKSFEEFSDIPICILPPQAYTFESKRYTIKKINPREYLSNFYKDESKVNKEFKRFNKYLVWTRITPRIYDIQYKGDYFSTFDLLSKLINKYLNSDWIPIYKGDRNTTSMAGLREEN